MEVYLQNYPGVAAVQATPTMTVTECVVTAITSTPNLQGVTYSYFIFDTPLQIPYDYVQVPACGYPLTTTPTILPVTSAVTFDVVAKTFTISSTDMSDAATGIAV